MEKFNFLREQVQKLKTKFKEFESEMRYVRSDLYYYFQKRINSEDNEIVLALSGFSNDSFMERLEIRWFDCNFAKITCKFKKSGINNSLPSEKELEIYKACIETMCAVYFSALAECTLLEIKGQPAGISYKFPIGVVDTAQFGMSLDSHGDTFTLTYKKCFNPRDSLPYSRVFEDAWEATKNDILQKINHQLLC